MIFRAALFAMTLSSPVFADQQVVLSENLFAAGTVLCSNFDARTRSCRTITTVKTFENGIRYSKSRRFVAMPDQNLMLQTEGFGRVDATRVCAIGPSADPVLTPNHLTYAPVLIAVYERRRDKKIARGVCHEYRRCGKGWEVYITYDDEPEPRLVSFTTVFGPNDPGRLGLTVRYRRFGVSEKTYSDCSPTG